MTGRDASWVKQIACWYAYAYADAGMTDGNVYRLGLGSSGGAVLCGSHLAGVLAADCAPSAGLLVTGGEDGLLRLWDVRARQPTVVLSPTAGLSGKAGSGAYPGNNPCFHPAISSAHCASCDVSEAVTVSGGGGWLHMGVLPRLQPLFSKHWPARIRPPA
jgi:WD40 repeat protein